MTPAEKKAKNIIKIAALEHSAMKPWDSLTAELEKQIALAITEAVAQEREECALLAVSKCWEATDMKYPKGRYQHEVAKKIAEAIRSRGKKLFTTEEMLEWNRSRTHKPAEGKKGKPVHKCCGQYRYHADDCPKRMACGHMPSTNCGGPPRCCARFAKKSTEPSGRGAR